MGQKTAICCCVFVVSWVLRAEFVRQNKWEVKLFSLPQKNNVSYIQYHNNLQYQINKLDSSGLNVHCKYQNRNLKYQNSKHWDNYYFDIGMNTIIAKKELKIPKL